MTTDREADSYERDSGGEYVRIFINDTGQPLELCSTGETGMCRLDEFVKSQGHARNDGFGDFEKCNHTGW